MTATTVQVPYSPLSKQFSSIDDYLKDIGALVNVGDFTLGQAVEDFEEAFAALHKVPFAVGVSSGTDALILSLLSLGVLPGDEIITVPNTFIATVGAIVAVGAKPVFVDVLDDYLMDPDQLKDAITDLTRAIIPVHLTGNPADMASILAISTSFGLHVIEDAAQAAMANSRGIPVGSRGYTGCFSLHPLKNLNVWGDGGIITCVSQRVRDHLRLLRNHGLSNRDTVSSWGRNCRLDTLHALIGLRQLPDVQSISQKRADNALYLDNGFSDIPEWVMLPQRNPDNFQVYHTYVIRTVNRDDLLAHLLLHGIEAKVHYPIPVDLQPAAKSLGYQPGDFPNTEAQAESIITLPVHQYLSTRQLDYMIEVIHDYYRSR